MLFSRFCFALPMKNFKSASISFVVPVCPSVLSYLVTMTDVFRICCWGNLLSVLSAYLSLVKIEQKCGYFA
jgi:hypothetical protein